MFQLFAVFMSREKAQDFFLFCIEVSFSTFGVVTTNSKYTPRCDTMSLIHELAWTSMNSEVAVLPASVCTATVLYRASSGMLSNSPLENNV